MTDPAIIEAAARLIAYSWDEATDDEREYSRETAHAILTAITPLIEAAALERAAKDLREALKECSDELAEWVQEHYRVTLHHPSEKLRYDRDMEPVLRARALIAKDSGGGD